ncbi:MAG: hypothetical protein CO125_02190 [Hydrogenophilales bacterium CG_4_9_14_3_um_filter_59_35]|nr:MAG: hypothetical protein COW70_08355 [Hydrogenophilales bacterium CG18_big_fil_WC_8_21_14_2_50_58_12]PIX98747.1 MAG: hypothetical protein COZ23_13195 [Hydrogenophilales bacterium CG_4_10_14_3_um_filter_58_23]PJB08289.1 MAG: hypothetical protein CO125_02190 [Hydrogenophilales bacterium CG_4_9_14_3_um_filter_59_35]
MTRSRAGLGKTLFWGGISALFYFGLFYYAEEFLHLAHTTQDACAVTEGMDTLYYNKTTPDLCVAKGGSFIKGTWWFVFAPIAVAFTLSFVHGVATGLFWDRLGMKAKK